MYQYKRNCLLAGLVLQATSASAQNLIQNPDFNDGLTGWTVEAGIFAIDAADGSPGEPSLHATTAPVSGTVAYVNSPCIQLAAPQSVDLSANMKVVSNNGAEVDLYGYSDTACANFTNVVGLLPAPQTGAWGTHSSTNIALPIGTQSVMLQLIAFSQIDGGSVDIYFDHILFGPTGTTPVRLQSFDVE